MVTNVSKARQYAPPEWASKLDAANQAALERAYEDRVAGGISIDAWTIFRDNMEKIANAPSRSHPPTKFVVFADYKGASVFYNNATDDFKYGTRLMSAQFWFEWLKQESDSHEVYAWSAKVRADAGNDNPLVNHGYDGTLNAHTLDGRTIYYHRFTDRFEVDDKMLDPVEWAQWLEKQPSNGQAWLWSKRMRGWENTVFDPILKPGEFRGFEGIQDAGSW